MKKMKHYVMWLCAILLFITNAAHIFGRGVEQDHIEGFNWIRWAALI
jgi:hypothetical protein